MVAQQMAPFVTFCDRSPPLLEAPGSAKSLGLGRRRQQGGNAQQDEPQVQEG